MRCLFCKQQSEQSHSEEHIIPESIGNTKYVLPPGVVCDQCNNYFARKVEGPLLSHPSMRNIRAWYQVPNKKGVSPSLYGFVAGTDIDIALHVTKDGKLDIQPEKGNNLERLKEYIQPENGDLPSNPLLFTLDLNPPKREMSRLLAKMALEAVALRFIGGEGGTDKLIDEPFFDSIRNYARVGNSVSDWIYHQRRIFPEETLMRHAKTGEWVQAGFGFDIFLNKRRETLFAFCLYGVEFVINVGGPSIKGYQEWLDDHHQISPLVERVGAKLTSEGNGKNRKFYLLGEYNVKAGVDFDIKHTDFLGR